MAERLGWNVPILHISIIFQNAADDERLIFLHSIYKISLQKFDWTPKNITVIFAYE